MAYSFIQQVEATFTAVAPALTPAANDSLIIVVFSQSGAPSAEGITDGGVGNTYVQRLAHVSGTNGMSVYDCIGTAKNLSTTITWTHTGGTASGIYVAQYRDVPSVFLGLSSNVYSGDGSTGANKLNSGIVTGVIAGSMLFGFACDANAPGTTDGMSAGTSPVAFTGRTKVWSGFDAGLNAMAEDASVNANAAATWGITANAFDGFFMIAAAYGPPPPPAFSRPYLGGPLSTVI